eukprot:GFYU01003653.1.p1 GENE.GFYU01003653.1~~GFYU01003653.1.p1  ORF type:complete len:153 (+),score=48.22 GFYU01003653.1:87-545(+)
MGLLDKLRGDKGVVVNITKEELFNAVKEGDLKTVKKILKKKPEFVSATDWDGWTPLHYACLNDSGLPMVKCLIESTNADPNVKDNEGNTPLHYACGKDSGLPMVMYLIESANADPNVKNIGGETPLDIARRLNNNGIVNYLESRDTSTNTAQ